MSISFAELTSTGFSEGQKFITDFRKEAAASKNIRITTIVEEEHVEDSTTEEICHGEGTEAIDDKVHEAETFDEDTKIQLKGLLAEVSTKNSSFFKKLCFLQKVLRYIIELANYNLYNCFEFSLFVSG